MSHGFDRKTCQMCQESTLRARLAVSAKLREQGLFPDPTRGGATKANTKPTRPTVEGDGGRRSFFDAREARRAVKFLRQRNSEGGY